MEVTRIEVVDSPEGPERVRLLGEVKYDTGSSMEQLWFDYPRRHADALSLSGNPWLCALLPLAVTLKEPLRIRAPVDAQLLKGVKEINRIWRCWYPHVRTVTIEAEPTAPSPSAAPTRTAAFFSGGLDSFFTVLRSRVDEPLLRDVRIDDLITIWGFDVPLEHKAAGQQVFQRHQSIAAALGMDFVGVATNLRATRWREADWELLAHGPALAAVALGLERRYHTVLLAATGGYRDLHHWGSHPLTDPLLSTATTTFCQDGAAFTRVEKTRLLVESELALQSLRVCWKSGSADNCGNCNKCYRTMLILELLGGLARCPRFGHSIVDLHRAARIYCARPWDFRELRDIQQLALVTGRRDVAAAVQKSMERSQRLTWRLERLRFFRRWGSTWRWSQRAEKYLLQNWIV